jgi:protein-S-isoprenylcysteine O-methyltransferase Ste14
MELPALLVPVGFFIVGDRFDDAVAVLFISLWAAHYCYRAVIYPFLSRVPGRPVPLSVSGLAFVFNIINGAIQGAFLFLSTPPHTTGWFTDGRFGLGLGLFAVGFFIHLRSDAILRRLRWTTESGYRIPHGFLYRWVSAPNYLGEMTQWIGWALLTWSLAGASFAVWTIANLLPRALANHRWYRETFEDYPESRKAVVPFLL